MGRINERYQSGGDCLIGSRLEVILFCSDKALLDIWVAVDTVLRQKTASENLRRNDDHLGLCPLGAVSILFKRGGLQTSAASAR